MNTQRINGYLLLVAIITVASLSSCKGKIEKPENNTTGVEVIVEEKLPYNTNDPKGMLLAVAEANGGMDKLKSLNDVEFDYHYLSPDGKKDISKERYIFKNEASWAKYDVHEINAAPELEGDIVQFFDGKNTNVYNNTKPLYDPAHLRTGQFLRQANYMWFTMMFKLSDPGILYTYNGQEEIEEVIYDKVTTTYDPAVTGKEVNDIYVLYVNPETRMVDSFYFSLPALGVEQPALHAKLSYTEIDGIQVITKRMMSAPSPDGKGMLPLVEQLTNNVKFNNGFTTEMLRKEI